MGAYPQIADWNEDGKIDLLVGDTNGKITLFINTGTKGNPQLTSKGFIKVGSTSLNVGNRASPVVVDWNNDGKKDLVVGDDNGYVRLYLNIGTNSAPAFTNYTRLKAGGYDIRNSYSASPEVCDLDNDGKKDLLVSDYDGYVYFYTNTGEDANPSFASGEKLKAGGSNGSNMKVGSYARLDVADWDEDGDLDILLGETDAYINLFLGSSNPSSVADNLVELPSDFSLSQNYPNPFNSTTTICFQLPKPVVVNLSIFNLSGQLIEILVNEYKMPGYYSFQWEAHRIVSGIYFIKLKAGEYSEIKKCILQK
ncbi:MAG: T9SS type A sorting domain-containing protein [bacterium]|nr:MAG: T9SS type A sorting domain-containing protein [bacterium]